MAGAVTDVAAILSAVLSQIKKLTEEQAQSLVTGTGEFRFVPKTLASHYTKLTKLSDEQLQQLADGEATYALVPKGYKVTKVPSAKAAPPTASEIRSALSAASDEESARAYLTGLKLKPAELKAVASELEVPATSSAKTIIETMVKIFVTGRLTTSAVRF
ncbi:hypothetical protein F4553_003042 [Allocatelliglobosispora scoriae]|uniref:Uncharacterized protein n=1 Tax=Allocatelliglobosispora scoriae TaxID=643052 RepID=A0A841BRY0_9ACTN|nr:hypothetical protein [Allocatelliglobosispora scoriae]MBB5869663.1 hypothetical protein [Allocatelliglobosispora scoriae]